MAAIGIRFAMPPASSHVIPFAMALPPGVELVDPMALSPGELEHLSPVALPGERTAAFTIHYGARDSQRVGVVSLQTGERTPLPHGNGARSLPTGHVVFQRNGALWAAPFDQARTTAVACRAQGSATSIARTMPRPSRASRRARIKASDRWTSRRHAAPSARTRNTPLSSETVVPRSIAAPTAARQANAILSSLSGALRRIPTRASGMNRWTGIMGREHNIFARRTRHIMAGVGESRTGIAKNLPGLRRSEPGLAEITPGERNFATMMVAVTPGMVVVTPGIVAVTAGMVAVSIMIR